MLDGCGSLTYDLAQEVCNQRTLYSFTCPYTETYVVTIALVPKTCNQWQPLFEPSTTELAD
mgnify:FL=1